MSTESLILHPQDSLHRLPPHDQLASMLRDMGLAGEPSEHIEKTYRPGPRFLEWITFASSHPVVELVEDGQGGLTKGPPRQSLDVHL